MSITTRHGRPYASGLIKACGNQWVAGPVVVLAYYVVGLPLAYGLAFNAGLGAMGLAIGATVGTVIHSIIICVIVSRTDWGGEARRAAERLAESKSRSQMKRTNSWWKSSRAAGGGGGNGGGGGVGYGDEEAAAPESLLPTVGLGGGTRK